MVRRRYDSVLPDRAITVLAAICGGAAAAAGVLVLFSALGTGFPADVFAAVGISLAYFALVALVIFVVSGLALYFVPRPTASSSRIVRLGRELLIGPIWGAILLTYVFLAMFIFGTANIIVQIGFTGALFGDSLERHIYLMLFSLIAGALFGITTALRGKWKHRLEWRTSTGHGMNCAVISGFLIYAGLVLMNHPIEWITEDAATVRANPWMIFVATAETMLVLFGTVAIITIHVRSWPMQRERIGTCQHGSSVMMWLKNFRLRWRRWRYQRKTGQEWPLFP